MTITITEQELYTIMAALRFWQEELHDLEGDYPGEFWDIASGAGAFEPLDDAQIDALYDDLNGVSAPVIAKQDDIALLRDAARILEKYAIPKPCPIQPHQPAATDGDAAAEPSR